MEVCYTIEAERLPSRADFLGSYAVDSAGVGGPAEVVRVVFLVNLRSG